jgi:uncharacterized membrane protein YgcG
MNFQTGLAWTGWVLSTIALVLRFSVPKYCKYPTSLVQLMLFGFWIVTFNNGFLLTVVGGWNYVCCEWTNDGNAPSNVNPASGTVNTYRPRFCPGSYLLKRYGQYVVIFSWTAVAVTAAITVFFKANKSHLIWRLSTLAIIFLLPLLLMFSEAYAQAYIGGPGIGGATCVVSSTRPEWQIAPVAQWIVFIGPIFACIAIGTVCIVYMSVQMIRVSDSGDPFHIINNARLLVYLFWMIVLACTFLGYFIHVYLQALPIILDPARLDPFVVWLLCGQTEPLSTCPPKLYTYNASYFGWWVCIDGLSAILISLLFLSQKDLYVNWSSRIFPWVGVWNGIKSAWTGETYSSEGSTATTGGSSSGGSSSTGASDTMMSDLN